MAVLDQTARPKPKIVEKEWIRKQLDRHDARTGFVPVPGATAEMAQEMIAESLRARGIDAEGRAVAKSGRESLRARGIDPGQIIYVQDRDERNAD